MTRNEFDESPDAMVIVVWFDHADADFKTGYMEFSGDGDVCARALAHKKRLMERYPNRTYECMINGTAIVKWCDALTNSAEYQKKGWKKFLRGLRK